MPFLAAPITDEEKDVPKENAVLLASQTAVLRVKIVREDRVDQVGGIVPPHLDSIRNQHRHCDNQAGKQKG